MTQHTTQHRSNMQKQCINPRATTQTQQETGQTSAHALPLPPEKDAPQDMAIYARFMRYLRHVPNSRPEIKILSALQFTADILDYSDAHVSKTLVELGLRAERTAFPADFLNYADQCLTRNDWEIGCPTRAMRELKDFWDKEGSTKDK